MGNQVTYELVLTAEPVEPIELYGKRNSQREKSANTRAPLII